MPATIELFRYPDFSLRLETSYWFQQAGEAIISVLTNLILPHGERQMKMWYCSMLGHYPGCCQLPATCTGAALAMRRISKPNMTATTTASYFCCNEETDIWLLVMKELDGRKHCNADLFKSVAVTGNRPLVFQHPTLYVMNNLCTQEEKNQDFRGSVQIRSKKMIYCTLTCI